MVVQEPGHEGFEDTLAFPTASGREGPHGGAVVPTVAGNHLVLARVPGLLPVLSGELQGGLGRFGPAGKDLDSRAMPALHRFRREASQARGKVKGGDGGPVQRWREMQGA